MSAPRWRRVVALALVSAVFGLTGCATTSGGASAGQRLDPFENWNRKVFGFNEALDKAVLKPVATTYKNVVPEFARTGVSNFFNNFADAWSAINNFLQGKLEAGLNDTMRVATNTVLGFGGVLDIASEAGLEHHYEDFGQTLGRWGFGAGAYIVWPVIGPSTVRETFALPLDRMATPVLLVNDTGAKVAVTTLQLVNTRANLLGATSLIDDIALDKYNFVRDAYLTRRRSLVYDGEPPERDGPPSSENPAPADAPASAPAR